MRKAVSKLVDSSCQTFNVEIVDGNSWMKMMKCTYCFEHFEHLPSFTTDILFERLAKHSGHQFSQLKAKQDQRAVTTVAIKKGGGGHKLDKKKAQLEIAKSFGCF